MPVDTAIALGAGLLAIVSSIVTPAIIVGRYLGGILTTQAQHTRDHERHDRSAASTGQRIEGLVREVAEIRGELRGRGDVG